MANKPEIRKRKNAWWKRKGKERKTNQKTFSTNKKEEARNVSEQRLDTRNPCKRYHPFSRQQHGRATDAHELPHTNKD